MKNKIFIIPLFIALFSTCKNKESNCSDFLCSPCPPYQSERAKIIELDTLLPGGFSAAEMDTLYIRAFDSSNIMVDSALIRTIGFDGNKTVRRNIIISSDFYYAAHGNPKIMYYQLSIKGDSRKFTFRDFVNHITPPDPKVCCDCGASDFVSVNINNTIYNVGQLPLKVRK